MEKRIQFLVRKWKGKADASDTDSGEDLAALERSLENIWQKTANYKTQSFKPDVDANWKKFQSKIQAEAVEPEVRRLFPRAWLAVAAMLGVGIFAWYLITLNAPIADFQILTTDSRQIKSFTLPDQSRVWLYSNSELSFDPQLAKRKLRRVKLQGEAFFEVKSNAGQTFQIETPQGLVEVLGTSFNVRALNAEPMMEVQVMSGRVVLMRKTQLEQRIEIPANHVGFLSAGQAGRRASINGQEKVFGSAAAWRARQVDLSGRPLSEAREIMRRYSKYRLEFSDPQLADCIFTWTLQLDQPETSLQLLAKIGFFRLEKTSPEVFRLVGKACP